MRTFTFFLCYTLLQSLFSIAQEPLSSPTSRRTYHCLIRGDSTKAFTVRYAIIQSVTDSGFYYSAPVDYARNFKRETRFMSARHVQLIKVRRKGGVGIGLVTGAGIGFVGMGLLGFANVPNYGILEEMPPGENALAGGLIGLLPGAGIGAAIGASRDKIRLNRDLSRYSQALWKIRRYANE